MTGAYELPYVVTFVGGRKRCWVCGDTLTAKQPDGKRACPWHWDAPVQLELGA